MHRNPISLFAGYLLFTLGTAWSQSLQITEIEVNQALGKQLNNSHNFVAGKDTIVRAFLSAPTVVDAAQTSLTIQRDGSAVVTLTPVTDTNAVSVIEFPCPSRETCGNYGVNQLNITLATDTPSGTQPLVITVGANASASTATLEVK